MSAPGFFSYAQSTIEMLREKGRYDAAVKRGSLLRSFRRYLGEADELPFSALDARLMQDYQSWLKSRKLSYNSVSHYMRGVKSIYEQAVSHGLTPDNNPFAGVQLSHRAVKKSRGLTLDEFRRLSRLDLSLRRRNVQLARDLFVFSVHAHGMSGRDLLFLPSDAVSTGRLTYLDSPTGRHVSVAWTSPLTDIAARYREAGTPYLFPLITSTDAEEQWRQHVVSLMRLNRNLHTVGRLLDLPLTLNMTVARHTWPSILQDISLGNLL